MFWYTMTINLYVPAPSPLFVLLSLKVHCLLAITRRLARRNPYVS